jgi:tetratricopeptide (TPR) repeat protein
MAGRTPEAIAWAERARPFLERFGLADDLLRNESRLLAHRCTLDGDPVALEELRELARVALDPESRHAPHAVTHVLNVLAWVEHWCGAGPAAGAEALRTAEDIAGRRGLDRPAHWYRASLAEPLFDLGDWDEVLRIDDEIASWERERGRSSMGVFAPPSVAKIFTARGELPAAAAVVEELVPRAREVEGQGAMWAVLAAAAGEEAARGESASAVALLQEFEQLTPDVAEVLGWLPEIARVCARTGELGVLERLLAAAGALHPRLGRWVWSPRAIFAEASGDHEEAETLYARAEREWNELGFVVERAYALLGLGRCRLALGRPADAAQPLGETRGIFAKLGARPLVADADELLTGLAPEVLISRED